MKNNTIPQTDALFQIDPNTKADLISILVRFIILTRCAVVPKIKELAYFAFLMNRNRNSIDF